MNFKEIKSAKELAEVLNMFSDEVKLIGCEYIPCNETSDTNDVRTAVLTFKSKSKFQLKFTNVDCVHFAPVSFGSIYLNNVALGQFRNLFFWSDNSEFNLTMPDSSSSYVVAGGLWLGK